MVNIFISSCVRIHGNSDEHVYFALLFLLLSTTRTAFRAFIFDDLGFLNLSTNQNLSPRGTISFKKKNKFADPPPQNEEARIKDVSGVTSPRMLAAMLLLCSD